jgi:carbamoyltransferase
LKRGEVIATCISNIETGPRSLGNRSLICNADNYELVKKLSNNLKGRENFIPTAPSMLMKTADKYYNLNESLMDCYQTMSALADLKVDLEGFKFKGIVHKDLTSRIHICNESSFIGKLLKYEDQSIEILANTSFNYKNDPISYGHEDSILALKKMKLKYLITDFGIYKIK